MTVSTLLHDLIARGARGPADPNGPVRKGRHVDRDRRSALICLDLQDPRPSTTLTLRAYSL